MGRGRAVTGLLGGQVLNTRLLAFGGQSTWGRNTRKSEQLVALERQRLQKRPGCALHLWKHRNPSWEGSEDLELHPKLSR